MRLRRHHMQRAVLALATAAACAFSITVTASAFAQSAASGRASVPMSQPVQALASSTDLGPTLDSTPMQVSIILRLRQSTLLQAAVSAGWPRPYLTTAQFAATYGQSASAVSAIVNYLARFGIQSTVYADNLDISAVGTVGEFSQALAVDEHNYRLHEPNILRLGTHLATVYAPTNGPTLPRPLAGYVLAILGLSNYSSMVSNVARVPAAVKNDLTSTAGLANPPSAFSDRYGLTPLLNAGARGQGRTIGIITYAAFYPPDAYTFWNDVLGLGVPHGRIALEPIDGGSQFDPGGTIETDLDVEEAGAVAPGANLRVYESNGAGGESGWADPFFAVASDNIADTVSVSWGNSETIIDAVMRESFLPSTYFGILDEAYLEMAAQGQTAFAASGDNGAYQAVADIPTTNLSVNYPSDSPYVTSAGGTTLPGTVDLTPTDADGNQIAPGNAAVIPAERAWGSDYVWPFHDVLGFPSLEAAATTFGFGFQDGGGGGFSSFEPRPIYQSGVIGYQYRRFLTPTQPQEIVPGDVQPTAFSFNPAPALGHGVSFQGRGEPDISTDADPWTGYEIYDGSYYGAILTSVGGTSIVAPQLAGSAAVIDSADGGRTGFWNPAIYRAAYLRIGSPFTALNSTTVYSGINYLYATALDGTKTALPGEFSNDNLYYTGTPGAVWNPATGLGTPNLAKLAKVLRR